MDAVSSGRRVSLVAWILSKEAEPQSSPFWDDAQSTHEHVLVDAGRARMAGRNFPRELELHTLMILGNVVMRQGNWSRLLELSAVESRGAAAATRAAAEAPPTESGTLRWRPCSSAFLTKNA